MFKVNKAFLSSLNINRIRGSLNNIYATIHEMEIPVPVWPKPEVILKIPVPVIPTGIGMSKFQFWLVIDPSRS